MSVYGFRKGSRDYPRSIEGPYTTLGDAREAAYKERAMGWETGRVRRVETPEEFFAALESLRQGRMPEGW